MKPRLVLLDDTFIAAMTQPESPWYATARASYQLMVEQFSRNEIRLVAAEDVLQALPLGVRTTLLAPIDRLRVSKRQRYAAAQVQQGYGPELALTLVLAKEERVDFVASFETQLGDFKLCTVTHPAVDLEAELNH